MVTNNPKKNIKQEDDDVVLVDKKLIIEILKALEGLKRVLHDLIK